MTVTVYVPFARGSCAAALAGALAAADALAALVEALATLADALAALVPAALADVLVVLAAALPLPEALAAEMQRCKSDEEVARLGVEWAVEQCKDLYAHGVGNVHFYTVSAVDSVREVAARLL